MYRVAILLFAATLGVNEDLLEASRTGDLAAVQALIAKGAREPAPAQVVVEFDSASSFTLKQGGGSFRFKKVVTP
jgi:hypothetical protein